MRSISRTFSRLAAGSVLLSLSALSGGGAALAQDAAAWPQRPVRVVVPYAAGASTDNVTRRLAQSLSVRLGQNFTVENRTGAMGTIGTLSVIRAAPDGYTLVANDTTNVILPHVVKSIPYDSVRELVPIAGFVFSPLGIVVTSDSPYKTLQDLIEAARAQPGKISFGSGGAGSSPHLASEDFAAQAGVKLLHVPYKGAGEAVVALMGRQIDMQFVSPSTALGNIRAGRLRMLAITADSRLPLLPDVPTFAEAGLKGFGFSNWVGWWAPKDTPEPILAKLRQEIAAVLESPELRSYSAEIGAPPRYVLGADFAKLIDQESARWKAVTERIGLEKQ